MQTGRVLYWLLTGALIGFGVIGILSIGLPFLLAGLVMVVFGAIRLGGSGIWALPIGLGGVPALILLIDIVTAPPPCPAGPITLPPGVHSYSCSGHMDAYPVMAAIFGLIALVGLIWCVVAWRMQAPRRGAEA